MTADEVRLVCSSDLFASLPRAEALGFIARLGFRYVDLWSCPPMCYQLDPLAEEPESVRAELEREGLNASSLSLFLMVSTLIRTGDSYRSEAYQLATLTAPARPLSP